LEGLLSALKRICEIGCFRFCTIVLKNSKIGPGEETRQIEIRR